MHPPGTAAGHRGPRNVVVTGLSAITPAGVGIEALWAALLEGRSFGARITAFDVSRNQSQVGAAADAFDPRAAGLSEDAIARLDRSTMMALACARAAIDDAELRSGTFRPARVGVCIGSAIGGVDVMERAFRHACVAGGTDKPDRVMVRPDRVGRNIYGGFLAASISTEVARDHGFTGPCTTMATGCTAGIDAIGTAAGMIESGMADIVVTGGADAPLTPIVLTSFDNIRAITRRNEQPSRASRPFDRERDGFLLAEGSAILVLEDEVLARRRGARIYGRILGFASTSNAHHMTGLPADGEALACTISRALARAAVDADDVDYINAHGSSTQQNDRNETGAFKRVFGKRAYRIPISSTKSCVGHALGAASAIEAAVCFLALCRGVVPPTLNYETASPDCDLDYVPNAARDARVRVILKNASGFSGIHSATLFAHRDHAPRSRSEAA